MIYKNLKEFLKYLLIILVCSSYHFKSKSNNFYDYPLYVIVDACKITQKVQNPNTTDPEIIIKGREKYRLCMNFIMSLSTTLNSRCMASNSKILSPEETFTYADLSEVDTTVDLISEVLLYSEKYPHFNNQIAWLHISKAISQKWPCKKLF